MTDNQQTFSAMLREHGDELMKKAGHSHVSGVCTKCGDHAEYAGSSSGRYPICREWPRPDFASFFR